MGDLKESVTLVKSPPHRGVGGVKREGLKKPLRWSKRPVSGGGVGGGDRMRDL